MASAMGLRDVPFGAPAISSTSPSASASASAVASPSGGSTPHVGSTSHSASPAPAGDDIQRRVAEAKRRVAEAQSKLAVKDNPYMVRVAHAPFSRQSQFSLTRLRDHVEYASAGQEEGTSRACSTRCGLENGRASVAVGQHARGTTVEEGPLQADAAQVRFDQGTCSVCLAFSSLTLSD